MQASTKLEPRIIMSTLAQYSVGNSHQRTAQLSPLTAAAPMSRRYGPDTAGRPVMLDPCTGQSVCGSPVDNRSATLLHPTSAAASHRGLTAAMYAAAEYAAADKSYAQYAVESSLYYPPTMATGGAVCYPYDLSPVQFSYYGDSCGYGAIDLNGARRKNATRETTSTLKAWLYEHRKNPYPTKGEKIMLAIITKMTLTQVSTWFANARRRLKKENKVTWSPRNRCGDGRKEDYESEDGEDQDRDDDMDGLGTDLDSNHNGQDSEIDQAHDNGTVGWNITDTAKLNLNESYQERLGTPPGFVGSDSGRDSLSVTDNEEDAVSHSREHCSPISCHRRSPSPAPLMPSAIRPTCRPTSRTPPCEKVLPIRQTEKPKIWSLAETALSKSPERRPLRPTHHLNVAGSQSHYHPYNSHLSTHTHRMDRPVVDHTQQRESSLVNMTRAGHFVAGSPSSISSGLTASYPNIVPLVLQGALSSLQLHHDKAATVNTT